MMDAKEKVKELHRRLVDCCVKFIIETGDIDIDIDRQDIFALGRQLCASNTDKRNNGEYILLVIDLSMLPDTFELYLGPRYEYGYYTKETIPTTAITMAKKFNLRNTIASYEAIF